MSSEQSTSSNSSENHTKLTTIQSKNQPSPSVKKLLVLSTKKAINSDVAPWMNASASELNIIQEQDTNESIRSQVSNMGNLSFEEKKKRLEAVSPWLAEESAGETFGVSSSRLSTNSSTRPEVRRENSLLNRTVPIVSPRKAPNVNVSPWLAEDFHLPEVPSILSFDQSSILTSAIGKDTESLYSRKSFDALSFGSKYDLGSLSDSNDHRRTTFASKYKKDKIYLTSIIFNEKKDIIMTTNGEQLFKSFNPGMLPSIQIYGDEEDSGEMFDNLETTSEIFMWARQTCLDWEPQVSDVADTSNPFSFTQSSLYLRSQEIEGGSKAVNKFKKKYLTSCMRIQDLFKLKNFGVMNRSPIIMKSEGCVLILQIVFAKKENVSIVDLKNNRFVWRAHGKLDSSIYNRDNHAIWAGYDKIYLRSMQFLNSGLYVVLFNCLITVQGPMVMVQKQYPNLPPIHKLRDKFELESIEFEILQSAIEDDSMANYSVFTRSILDSFDEFQGATSNDLSIKHLLSGTPTLLDNDVAFLIVSSITPLGQKIPNYDFSLYELVPLSFFEMIHFSSYLRATYKEHFRQVRLATKTITPSHSKTFSETPSVSDLKSNAKKFNDSKWTRQALSAVMMSSGDKEKMVIPNKKEKYVNPF